ncbi:YdcF family protein [Bosea sp. (in: a-proteobacteria)]|uniref:YdcF family protein n=1 Tax=Bosea sp. (in: a-proteobacteria) TaxID=1871050 RepID=UPI00261EB6B5|nr:YdcF family protein [Bosea sp. (in: a-proteobacteria)]MCO5090783.1 YdcF family protein [Bosea sp. (in: a-proteobacteria)]
MAMIGSTNDHLAMAPSASTPAGGKPSRPARLRRMLGWTATAALATGLVLFGIGYIRFATMIDASEPVQTPRTDAIVVVTGGAQRVGDAIGLLGAERGERLLISGVNEKTGREELVKLNPAARNLLACCVDLDYRARNTIGNAIETRRWVRRHGFRSLLVVTSNYHMPRTLAELSHAMPEVRLVAHPVVTDHIDAAGWWNRWPVVKVLVPEYAKYLVARLRSLVESDPETSRLSVIIGGRKPVSPKPADTLGPAAEKRSRLIGQHPREG